MWDTINTTGEPKLVAGGGTGSNGAGGGLVGGKDGANLYSGYSWDGTIGNNYSLPTLASHDYGATGGGFFDASPGSSNNYASGGSGTTTSGCTSAGYNSCVTITGGNAPWPQSSHYGSDYHADSYGNWGTNTLTGGKGYASIRWCGPSGSASSCPDTCSTDSDCPTATPYCQNGFCNATQCSTDANCSALYPSTPYCIEGFCEATKSCTSSADCTLAAQPYCEPSTGVCDTTPPAITCGGTTTVETRSWVAYWANCTTCPAGTFKHYKTFGDLYYNECNKNESCSNNYPVAHSAGCINIPALNSYTIMPTGWYGVLINSTGSWKKISNGHVWHRQVNITCNGKNEEWDFFGTFINWWEAQEVCAKLGKTLPANTETLTGGCTEGARWSLIKNAIAVGTGKKLEGLTGSSVSWNSSTGDSNSGSLYPTFTQQDFGDYKVWRVSLNTGVADTGLYRSFAESFWSVLCGPAN